MVDAGIAAIDPATGCDDLAVRLARDAGDLDVAVQACAIRSVEAALLRHGTHEVRCLEVHFVVAPIPVALGFDAPAAEKRAAVEQRLD